MSWHSALGNFSAGSSYQSFYTADTSLSYASSCQKTDSVSPASSFLTDMSPSYSVTSINSYKSRKNILYPRRAHPPPVTALPDYAISPHVLAWQVHFLCTTLLPHAGARFVPAGMVLLRSLGLQADISQGLPEMNDESLRCSEFFVVLIREVLLKDAAGAKELEGPCELLHKTFENILFKIHTFFPGSDPESKVLRVSHAKDVVRRERSACVLRTLCFVLDTFEGALNTCQIPDASGQDRHRTALLGSSVSTNLTLDQYRGILVQKLLQIRTKLYRSQQQGVHKLLPSGKITRMTHRALTMIEEDSETEGLPRKVLHRLLTPFTRKEGGKNHRKKVLVVSGIVKGDQRRLDAIRNWCESFGEVHQIFCMPNHNVHIHFRKAEVADTVCRLCARVHIAGVGSVSLSWLSGRWPFLSGKVGGDLS